MTRWQRKIQTLQAAASFYKSVQKPAPDYKVVRDEFMRRGMPFGKAYNAAIRYFRIFAKAAK